MAYRTLNVLIAAIMLGGIRSMATAKELSPQQRTRYEQDLARWTSLLEEYHRGQRDDSDGAAILWHEMQDFAILGSTMTPQAASALAEWRAIQDKHPEFKKHLSTEIHEELAAREERKQHAAQVDANAKKFVPTDSRILEIQGNDHKAVFIFQYHLEFYSLPPKLSFKPRPAPNSYFAGLYDGDKYIGPEVISKRVSKADIGLAPVKVLHFAHRIHVSSEHVNAHDMALLKYFWVCSDLVDGYEGSTKDELEITFRQAGGKFPWVDGAAEIKEFCGVIDLGGNIVYTLPIEPRSPDRLLVVAGTNTDGSRAVIKVGRRVMVSNPEDPDLNEPQAGQFSQYLIWSFPDKLQTFDGQNPEGLQAALDVAGIKMK